MICASVYLFVLIRNLLVHLAEKILRMQPLTFRGRLPRILCKGTYLLLVPAVHEHRLVKISLDDPKAQGQQQTKKSASLDFEYRLFYLAIIL